MRIPRSVEQEHDELHHELDEVSRLGGQTGDAAKRLARILQPHFIRENDYAVPPLSLLQQLTRGTVTAEMRWVLPLVERLKSEMPLMLREHDAIRGALHDLATAAESEGHTNARHFAERLQRHAKMEEEVLYPAAILVGELVKSRLAT